jgi:hypothetical protein
MENNTDKLLLDRAYIYASSKLLKDFDLNYDAYKAAEKDIYKENPIDSELLAFRTVRGHDSEGRDVFYKVTTVLGVDYKLTKDCLNINNAPSNYRI